MSYQEEESGELSPWWSKRGFFICAILVALLVAVALVMLLMPSNKDDESASAPATSASASSAAGPGDEASTCGLKATGGQTLTKAPKDVTWAPLRNLELPASKTHGPGKVDPTTQVRSCFARTPDGALRAATAMLGSSADPDVRVKTIEQRGVDSPGKTVALGKAQERASSGERTMPPMKIEGFRVVSFTKNAATVEVVVGADTGSETVHQATSADMVWQDGDWKFVFADDGSGGAMGSQVSDLSNYVKWGSNG